MSRTSGGGSRQTELFPRSKRPTIRLEENHWLVVLTEETDETELERHVEQIRRSKLKSATGRPPHPRALIGWSAGVEGDAGYDVARGRGSHPPLHP
jgi:hypothetical protein